MLLADDADGFARRAAGGPDVFDHEDAFARLDFEAAAKRHLAGAVTLHENCADAKAASDFVADDQSAESRRDDAIDREVFEFCGQVAAESFGVLRVLKHERALNIGAAVAAAGKLEVAGAHRAHVFEQLHHFFASHRFTGLRVNHLRAFNRCVKRT